MKTEELEQSLRAEFEGQMKDAVAKMRGNVEDLQKNFESEFEKHRSQMDEAFRALANKLDEPFAFDTAFNESLGEHLRLARDEGALITATALGEAEKLGNDSANQEFEKLRDSINDVKSNTTQASILGALVDAAANFAPRGAFFIVKNDHLVGWKAFGTEELQDEEVVRSIHFPISDTTLVSNAVASLSSTWGGYADHVDNAKFLGPLSFGAPNRMVAIPLVARGRGVAVLYADGGEADENINLNALETIVSVAGLRVELLASETAPMPAETVQPAAEEAPEPETSSETQFAVPAVVSVPESQFEEPTFAEQVETPAEEPVHESVSDLEYVGQVEVAEESASLVTEFDAEPNEVEEPVTGEDLGDAAALLTGYELSSENFTDESPALEQHEAISEPAAVEEVSFIPEPEPETVSVQEAAPEPEPVAVAELETPAEPEPKPAVEEQKPAPGFRERTVDLPIDVSEEERRPHSDARRFARLLVSEIRLYNEQKVVEGRETGDIYEMLKEAIDRSREMYEKRVQPDVAAKFDYFHYELVNNLAEGDEEKLGAGYFAVKV